MCIRSCSGIEGLIQIALIVMKLWRCAGRVSTIFPLFGFFFSGKRGKGRNVSDNILFMNVYIVFCDVLIIRRYVCIFYHAAYIAFVYVYDCTDLKHNLM